MEKIFFRLFAVAILLAIGAGAANGKSPNNQGVLQQALYYADYVAEQMGIDLPPIHFLEGTSEAYAADNQIYIGTELANEMSAVGLAQIIMHEVGHVDLGHVGEIGDLAQSLHENGLISSEVFSGIMQGDEIASDVYAGIAAWMLENAADTPEISGYFASLNEPASETHPSSADRVATIAFVMDALDAAQELGILNDVMNTTELASNAEPSAESGANSSFSSSGGGGDSAGDSSSSNSSDASSDSSSDAGDAGDGGGGDGGGGGG